MKAKAKTPRPTFKGLYVRKTKTKKEKLQSLDRKYKKDYREEY